jgi:hypothetical protein
VALAGPSGALRLAVLHGAMLVTAAQLFAAQGRVAGAVGLACVALGGAALAVERRAALARLAEWSALALAAHVVLGMAGGLYERSALYDKAVHLAASYGFARLAARALARHVAREGLTIGPRLARWVPVLAALALGTLWELFEFGADATGLVVAQRGLADTMLDLAADAAGALAAAAPPTRRPRRATPSSSPRRDPSAPPGSRPRSACPAS